MTTATERITPDSQGRAEITFTVTNLSDSALSATLAVSTDADTTNGWFSVADHDRVIDAGASVPFVVMVIVPPGTPPAQYPFYAVVRSTGASENEEGVRSNPVILNVPPPIINRYKRKDKIENIVFAVMLVAVVVMFVGGAVYLASPWDKPTPQPSPSTSGLDTDSRIRVPNVLNATDGEAVAATLTEAGLVPVVKYKFQDADRGAVEQSPPPGAEASPGDVVVVTFAKTVSAPTNVTYEVQLRPLPAGINIGNTTVADVELAWEQAESFVTSWQIMFFKHLCADVDRGYLATGVGEAHTTRFRASRIVEGSPFNCGGSREAVYIAAVDDFGNLGPMSELIYINVL